MNTIEDRIKPRIVVAGTVLMIAAGAFWGGCREEPPKSELDRFVEQHRTGSAEEYEAHLRGLVDSPPPESVFANYELGNIYYGAATDSAAVLGWTDPGVTADLDSAKGFFEKAVLLDSTFVEAYVNLGSLWDDMAEIEGTGQESRHQRDERLKRAEQLYETALRFRPDDEKALCNLGSLYLKQRRTGDAVGKFETVLETHPKSALAHYNLAIVFAEEKMYREAIVEWEAAVDADPGGDVGERSRENIRIVKDLLEAKVPESLGSAGGASGE